MKSFLLSKDEQGIVIFHFLKTLSYSSRLFLALILIFGGMLVQYFSFYQGGPDFLLTIGLGMVLTGNLLVLVKGYNNRIKLDVYSADKEWITVDKEQLNKILEINRKARHWDISSTDISNVLGFFVFILLLGALIAIGISRPFASEMANRIIIWNTIILFVPHWFTGIRKITLTPKLVNKIRLFMNLMNGFDNTLAEDQVDYLVYVEGQDTMFPRDVKMKLKFNAQPEGFLGMYAQISMNHVNDRDYPYFYVVMVAKAESGMLRPVVNSLQLPPKVISEYKTEGEIELIVIRQHTTKTSGYYTKPMAMVTIFAAGIKSVRRLISAVHS
jgi:hypothetical protein